MDEPWTTKTIKKVRERAEICCVEAELASEPRKTELLGLEINGYLPAEF
jgi:hypothetical protein